MIALGIFFILFHTKWQFHIIITGSLLMFYIFMWYRLFAGQDEEMRFIFGNAIAIPVIFLYHTVAMYAARKSRFVFKINLIGFCILLINLAGFLFII